MSEHATYDDVNLLLRLYELRRDDKMREAREWFAGVFKAKNMEEFMQQARPGSGPNAWYRMVTSYWEMVASFITAGVLNKELFFSKRRRDAAGVGEGAGAGAGVSCRTQ